MRLMLSTRSKISTVPLIDKEPRRARIDLDKTIFIVPKNLATIESGNEDFVFPLFLGSLVTEHRFKSYVKRFDSF